MNTPQKPIRIGLTKKQKIVSAKLSYIMAIIHSLKEDEPPRSRKWNKLDNLEDNVGKVLDEYYIERMHMTDLAKATALFEFQDEKAAEMFGKKKSNTLASGFARHGTGP